MIKITEIRPLPHYKIWIRFSDGVEGIADLSHLAGKGVFSAWKQAGQFEKVYIHPESGTVAWDDDIDLCPDTLYMEITGKKAEAIFTNLKSEHSACQR